MFWYNEHFDRKMNRVLLDERFPRVLEPQSASVAARFISKLKQIHYYR
jgi:hypothetical protein